MRNQNINLGFITSTGKSKKNHTNTNGFVDGMNGSTRSFRLILIDLEMVVKKEVI